MGVIKTALEIALEKTENVKSDKTSIEQFEARQKGKKLANAFLGEDISLTDEIKNTQKESKNGSIEEGLKQGIFDVLITQISLPTAKEDEIRLEKLGKGLEVIIKNSKLQAIYKQMLQVFSQYLQEASHYEQVIRQQYAPKLRQKEEELSRRLGREVRIDPFQDPEFTAFYNQHMNSLRSNYEPIVEQVKEEIREMFDSAE